MAVTNRGFTLIELLVVIAIIGILSSVVLASLSTARNKGVDARIKAQLSSIRAAAEIYYDTNGSYGTPTVACNTAATLFTNANITNLLTGFPVASTPECISTAASWAVQTELVGDTGAWWCVDGNGRSMRTVADTIGTGGTDDDC